MQTNIAAPVNVNLLYNYLKQKPSKKIDWFRQKNCIAEDSIVNI